MVLPTPQGGTGPNPSNDTRQDGTWGCQDNLPWGTHPLCLFLLPITTTASQRQEAPRHQNASLGASPRDYLPMASSDMTSTAVEKRSMLFCTTMPSMASPV